MKKVEETLSQTRVYEGKILNVRFDKVRLPNGKIADREIVEHRGGVCALAVKDGCILFVSQFRVPLHEVILELPAGKIEPHEEPDATIIRELKEEIGATVKSLEKAGFCYPSPGYSEEKLYLYFTDDFELSQNSLDEDEFLDVVSVPIDHAYEMVDRGEITDAKSLILLLKYREKLIKNKKVKE
jgi:ADP-ribose pyrophosphatase